MPTTEADEIDIAAALREAVSQHESGKFAEAERLYRFVLTTSPGQPDANYNLGVLALQTGHAADALAHFRAALQADPRQVRHWLGCIGALIQLGQTKAVEEMLAQARNCGLDSAAENKIQALLAWSSKVDPADGGRTRRPKRQQKPPLMRQPKPRHPAPTPDETRAVLQLLQQSRYDETESRARALTTLYPQDGFGWKILGVVLDHRGQLDDALDAKQRAAHLLPGDHDAHLNFGNALRRAGKQAQAEVSYRNAIRLQPGLASAHNRLGIVLEAQGRVTEAEQSYRRAIALNPDFAEACSNLGVILWNSGRLQEAEACYRRAIEIDPNFAEFYSNLAGLLVRIGRVAEAEAACRRALTLKPSFAEAWNNLGDALQAAGRNREAVDAYRHALALKPDFPWAFSNLLFCLGHEAATTPQDNFARHLEFGQRFEAPLRSRWPNHKNTHDPERPLRIGVLSADLRDHAISYFTGPVLGSLAADPSLSLHAYYNNRMEDPVTRRLRAYFAQWTPVGEMTDADIATRIEADEIDIVLDLSGHTNGGRLLTLARKPAPIQCGWLGYLGTSGLQAIDYYLADPYFLPGDELQPQFTERLVHLPAVAPFATIDNPPEINPLPALVNGYATFGSFSRLTKLSPRVVALWSELLRALPDSQIVLGAMPKDGGVATISQWFADEGITADRLTFIHARFIRDYMELHRQIDLCLDPFPFTGATTIGHALWMGVPTLTLAGCTAPGRLGPAMLHHAGLSSFVAHDPADFVEKGLSHSRNLSGLADLRASLRDRLARSLIGQPEVIAKAMSRAFRMMWQRWCAGLPPEGFSIQMDPIPAADSEGRQHSVAEHFPQ